MVKEMKKCFRVGSSCVELNPLLPKSDLYILLCVKQEDCTRQRETPLVVSHRSELSQIEL